MWLQESGRLFEKERGLVGFDLVSVGFIGICVVFLFLVAYVSVREKEIEKKNSLFERSIEDLNHQVYRLKKQLKEQEIDTGYNQDVGSIVQKEVKKEIDRSSSNFLKAIEALEQTLLHHQEGSEEKIMELQERVRELGYFPTSTTTGADENKIISMFKAGWSVDSIAKELRTSKGEVEFTLKLANL